MRNRIIMTLLAAAVLACAASEPPGDADFDAFWAAFRAAVEQDAESDVRELTRFPLMYQSRDRSAGEFAAVYAALFDESARGSSV